LDISNIAIKAALFDLDDTLYDHQHGSRAGLSAVIEQYPCFGQKPFEQFEQDHETMLNLLHPRFLNGDVTLDEIRAERFHRLLAQYGQDLPLADGERAAKIYRTGYRAAERVVPGAIPLLERLRGEGIPIAVVTNSTVDEQVPKLERVGLTRLVDVLVVSEEVGVVKPDPLMFTTALDRLGLSAAEVVMMGDSWANDIIGATGVGIRAIWINRYGRAIPDPNCAAEINGLEPVEDVYRLVISS
jgi:HAD superfamily hydrolase (TIGR01549 family)